MLNLIKTFNRPLSPHLTIYSSQITSIFSIWHRITGISLILILTLSLILLKVISHKIFVGYIELIYENYWACNTLVFNLLLFFTYHSSNGLRHITWDLGYNLSVKAIQFSIWIIILLLSMVILLSCKILLWNEYY